MIELDTLEFQYATDEAILVTDGSKDIWLPISQVEITSETPFIIEIPKWLAMEKELI